MIKLHNYQKKCIPILLKNKTFGLFADPGLGKTLIILTLLREINWQKQNLKTLIIAPLSVCYNVWPSEIEKWNFKEFTYTIAHGKNKKNWKHQQTDIDILNCENIPWFFENIPKYDILIIDESSKFKSFKSKRFKVIKSYLHKFDRRYILTGTPASNSYMDLYTQMYILDKGELLGKNITAYRNNYFYKVSYRNFIEYKLKEVSDEQIITKIKSKVIRMDSESYQDLPALVINNIYFNLSKSIQKKYDKLEKEFIISLTSKDHTVKSSVECYNLCRQFVNGFNYLKTETNRKSDYYIHSEKLEILKNLLNELYEKPVLIAYHFNYDLRMLQTEFGNHTPYIGSGINANRVSKIIEKWNAKKIPILLAHPQSMSHGLNLQKGGNDIVWYTLTDNLENYIQYNKRIYRQNVKNQVRIHHLIAKNTIEEVILENIQNKDKNQTSLLDKLKNYSKTKYRI